ncbi:CoA transferase [Spongiactinospora sp. TRM90649]|uniref:CaiB/BaiF CoA-transferase family protein n=1 Tax=Spongiactinospora sp. TRM90649 TaxID=3031114 RepID=UPI0023F69301|nr:CoA transferase [Spongiactinospora sp. TRM90649]MDF5754324.1 CoA transferase [Spongiactinospora sp. TRM90649]
MTDREPTPHAVAPDPVLRVVEISGGVAGQVCGRLFAGFGHTVTKCEPPGGDPTRTQEPVGADGLGFTFAALNADKRSVTLDLTGADGRARTAGLLAGADILITDLGPGAAEAAGLSAERLRAEFPGLIVVSLTPYGLGDPRSDRFGDSFLAECVGGLATMVGEPARSPLSLGGEQTAHAAAFVAFFGAMLALRRPGGDVVDVALCDVAAYIDWKSDVTYAHTGDLPRRSGASAGIWRILRAADGWIGVVFQPAQWETFAALVGDPELADPRLREDRGRIDLAGQWWPVVERWAAGLPMREIYQRAQRAGLPFGHFADVADLVSEPQYRARGFITPDGGHVAPVVPAEGLGWRCGPPPRLGDAPPASEGASRRRAGLGKEAPLAGVTVLDLGTITAGAATGRLLADYGATVIKVEAANRPDPFRLWPSADGSGDALEESPLFESNNAGKLGVTLDLKSPDDLKVMRRLVARADVLIENFTVGVTERLGIDHATLREINPGLVYLSLSSQGQSGPEAHSRSYGSTLDLLSGLASVTGYDDGDPVWSSADLNYPDQIVSLFGAALVVYCLNLGVRGVHLDVSQRELVSWTLADRVAQYLETGTVAAPSGNRRPGSAPHDVYRCAGDDRWIAIVCRTGAERAALARLVGAAGYEHETAEVWHEHRREIDEAITGWTRARTPEDCLRELTEAGVTCAPVLSADTRAADPHFERRRVFLPGVPRRKGFPLRLRGYEPPDPAPAPSLGRDNAMLRGMR